MKQRLKWILPVIMMGLLAGCLNPCQKISTPVSRNSTRLAFFDFENGVDVALKIDPALATVTDDPTEVISGKYSLKLDTMADGKGLKDFVSTVAKQLPLQGGKRYELNFNYRVLDLGEDGHFYYSAETSKGITIHPWRRYFREQVGDPGFYRRKMVFPPDESGGTICIGVNNQASMIIDNIEIRQLQDFHLNAGIVDENSANYEPYGVCTHFTWVRGMPVADHPNWYSASNKQSKVSWIVSEETDKQEDEVEIDVGYTDDQVVEGVRLIKEAGIQWFRADASWADMEPKRGVYCQEKLDRLDLVVKEAERHDLDLYILLFSNPRWASERPEDEDFWAYAPSDMQVWKDYVRFIAERYKGKVTYWEIGNEIDWVFWRSDLEKFAQYLKVAYECLKDVDPDNQVIMSGQAFDGTFTYRFRPGAEENALQKLYDAGIKDYCDILAIHPYAHSWHNATVKSLDSINNFYSIMKANGDGDKPIWITELGESRVSLKKLAKRELGYEITEQEAECAQSECCRKLYAELIKHPKIDKIFWYTFRDSQCEYAVANEYGFLKMDMSPHPVYNMFKALPKTGQRIFSPQFLED